MDKAEKNIKKLCFSIMGWLLVKSINIKSSFRYDFLIFITFVILLSVVNSFFWYLHGGNQAGSSVIKGLIMWLLGLGITRCALTTRQGIDLLPLDRGAMKSFFVMLAYQGAMYLLIEIWRLSRHPHAQADALVNAETLASLGIALLIWSWVGARFLSMSQIAWMSDRPGFTISACSHAMKGRVWAYCCWIVICYIPPVLCEFIVLTIIGDAPADPRFTLLSGISGTMFFITGAVICQNFSIRLFRALGLDEMHLQEGATPQVV